MNPLIQKTLFSSLVSSHALEFFQQREPSFRRRTAAIPGLTQQKGKTR